MNVAGRTISSVPPGISRPPAPGTTDGCHAVAEAVAACRPDLICVPPGHHEIRILECLGQVIASGKAPRCKIFEAESDAAALSVATGASAAGGRAYAVTSGDGLLLMAGSLYRAASEGLPIVMTIVNGAEGSSRDALKDYTGGLSMRDAGWIQLHAETNQEAADLHVQAFRLAETLSCPVMVCVAHALLSGAGERVDRPTQAQVDAFLPVLPPRRTGPPASAGVPAEESPGNFMEMRYLAHHKQLRALSVIPQVAAEFLASLGRPSGGLLRTYLTEDAETVVVALGSFSGAIREVVDELRAEGRRIGLVGLCSFRPFPIGALRDVLQGARRIIVLERSLSMGLGGIVSEGVSASISGIAVNACTVIAGLGGRPVTRASLRQLFDDAAEDGLEQLTFLDLNADFIAGRLEQEAITCRNLP